MKYLTLAAGLLSLGSVLAQTVSTEGDCGGSGSITCQGSEFGNCCSQYGWVSKSSYKIRLFADCDSVAPQPTIAVQDVSPNLVHAPAATRHPRQSVRAPPWSLAHRLDHLQQQLPHPRRRSLQTVLVVAPTAARRVRDQGLETVAPAVDGAEAQQHTALLDVSQVLVTAKAA
jgi:hypothetical protein